MPKVLRLPLPASFGRSPAPVPQVDTLADAMAKASPVVRTAVAELVGAVNNALLVAYAHAPALEDYSMFQTLQGQAARLSQSLHRPH